MTNDSDVLVPDTRATWLREAHPGADGGGDGVTLVLPGAELPDLAPMIHRQRLVVEGHSDGVIDDATIRAYLRALTDVCDMHLLLDPVTHRSDLYGWAGWVHWETSGAHFYVWETPLLFFSVDIYACKPFDPAAVVDFTAEFLQSPRVVAKGF